MTGFYTLADADGRQRRVEYIADEAGFRAKVQTNELGTKSENSADVEVLASPPSEAQLAPVPVQATRVQQQVVTQATPARGAAISYVQQPAGYGYYGSTAYPAGYGYGQYGYAAQPYGYGYNGYASAAPSSPYGYGYTSSPSAGYGYTTGSVGNYNNHLPSQYYRSIGQTGAITSGVAGAQAVRYVTSNGAIPAGAFQNQAYRGYTSGVVPAGAYQNQGTYRSYSSSSSSSPAVSTTGQLGSSNYIVLKKREAEKKA